MEGRGKVGHSFPLILQQLQYLMYFFFSFNYSETPQKKKKKPFNKGKKKKTLKKRKKQKQTKKACVHPMCQHSLSTAHTWQAFCLSMLCVRLPPTLCQSSLLKESKLSRKCKIIGIYVFLLKSQQGNEGRKKMEAPVKTKSKHMGKFVSVLVIGIGFIFCFPQPCKEGCYRF